MLKQEGLSSGGNECILRATILAAVAGWQAASIPVLAQNAPGTHQIKRIEQVSVARGPLQKLSGDHKQDRDMPKIRFWRAKAKAQSIPLLQSYESPARSDASW